MIVPGNHDVNWDLCLGARAMASRDAGASFEEPCFAKFGNYQEFVDRFCAATDVLFDEEHLFHVYPFPEEQVLIVGFNTCIRESERDEDHYGWIGVGQAHEAAQRCDELDPNRTWLRIGCCTTTSSGPATWTTKICAIGMKSFPAWRKDVSSCSCTGTGTSARRGNGVPHRPDDQDSGHRQRRAGPRHAAGSSQPVPDHPHREPQQRHGAHAAILGSNVWFGREGRWIADPSIHESGAVAFSLGAPSLQRTPRPKPAKSSLADARKRLLAYLGQEHRFLQLLGFGADFRVPLELEPICISLRAVPRTWKWRASGRPGRPARAGWRRREPSGTSGPARLAGAYHRSEPVALARRTGDRSGPGVLRAAGVQRDGRPGRSRQRQDDADEVPDPVSGRAQTGGTDGRALASVPAAAAVAACGGFPEAAGRCPRAFYADSTVL